MSWTEALALEDELEFRSIFEWDMKRLADVAALWEEQAQKQLEESAQRALERLRITNY
jgi:hypothetical protein